MQIREGEGSNPTAAPKTAVRQQEEDQPQTNRIADWRYCWLLWLSWCFVWSPLLIIIHHQLPCFVIFFHSLKTPLKEASTVEKRKTFLRRHKIGAVGCATTKSTTTLQQSLRLTTPKCTAALKHILRLTTPSPITFYGILQLSIRLPYNRAYSLLHLSARQR
jgi:hypothetical protein